MTDCKNPYGHYVLFHEKETGIKVAEIDKKRESDFGYDGYVIYTGPGFMTEIGRRKSKPGAIKFAQDAVSERYPDGVEFKWNVMKYSYK